MDSSFLVCKKFVCLLLMWLCSLIARSFSIMTGFCLITDKNRQGGIPFDIKFDKWLFLTDPCSNCVPKWFPCMDLLYVLNKSSLILNINTRRPPWVGGKWRKPEVGGVSLKTQSMYLGCQQFVWTVELKKNKRWKSTSVCSVKIYFDRLKRPLMHLGFVFFFCIFGIRAF